MANTAKKIAISYTYGHNSSLGNIHAVLAYYGYTKQLPDNVAEAIEELKNLYAQHRELSAQLARLKDMKHRNRGWLPSHSECCDDEYQDGLELSWEIRDIEGSLNELNTEINRLKSIAKL